MMNGFMLTSRVFQFDMIPNQLMSTGERFHSFLDPALSMRCVAPERIAALRFCEGRQSPHGRRAVQSTRGRSSPAPG